MDLHHDMHSFEDSFNRGLQGKNLGIPTGFRRLSRYAGLRRGVYYLIGGYTGSGKTTLVDDAFVLHPAKWFLENKGRTDIDLKVIYFSMERKKELKIAKWIARFIFLQYGIIMSVDDILGWNEVLDERRRELVDKEKLKVNELLENVIDLHEGAINPTGVYHAIQDFASSRGREGEIEVTYRDGRKVMKKVWIPDNPSEVVIIVTDHIGLAKSEKRDGRMLSDKETLDKYSEYMRIARDYYNYTPVVLSQFNRDIANPIRLKHGDVEPMLEDFKGSGDSQEDAEVIISLFDPIRYKVADPSGYDLERTVDTHGRKKYRSLKILKNSYGSDDIRIGLAFQPEVGIFKEMPKRGDTTDETYRSIIDNTYFLPET
jgi:replicative DNA helicase